MAISQNDMISYFDIFGLGVNTFDSGSLECFKCGSILIYKNRFVGYGCVNGHSFSPHQLVMLHAEFMASLVSHLENKYICGVQMHN